MSEPSSTTISSLSPTSSGATSPTIPPTMSSADIQEFPAPPVASHFTMQIVDLKSSLNFFATVLGFKVLRHEEFDRAIPEVHGNGNHYKGRWSRTIVGHSDEDHFTFELIQNYGIASYQHGNALRWFTVAICGAASRAKTQGYKVTTAEDQLPVVWTPDGYGFKCVDNDQSYPEPVLSVSVYVSNLKKSIDFYEKIMGMRLYRSSDPESASLNVALIGYGKPDQQTKLELMLIPEGTIVDHGDNVNRIVFLAHHVDKAYERFLKTGSTILIPPTLVETPKKQSILTTIVVDRDGYQVAFCDEDQVKAYAADASPVSAIDWQLRDKKVESDGGKISSPRFTMEIKLSPTTSPKKSMSNTEAIFHYTQEMEKNDDFLDVTEFNQFDYESGDEVSPRTRKNVA